MKKKVLAGAEAGHQDSPRRRMPKLVEMKALPMEQLSPHPDAEAFGADEEDRQALRGSVAECGLLDPISVVPADAAAGGWLVIDGCGRLDAARARGYAYVPCMVFDLGDFSVREFALHRNTMQRKVTTGQRVLCYLAVSRDTGESMEKSAQKLGCSKMDIVAGSELRHEAEKEDADAAREIYDDVLAGRTPIRRWKAALAGRTATKDKPKKPIDYEKLAYVALRSLRTVAEAWPGLKGAVKDRIEEKFWETMDAMPPELRPSAE